MDAHQQCHPTHLTAPSMAHRHQPCPFFEAVSRHKPLQCRFNLNLLRIAHLVTNASQLYCGLRKPCPFGACELHRIARS